jgi:hypothetical protein
MNAIDRMRERHEKEIEELQNECEHKQATIMPYYWAIAHYAGYDVEVCDECGKTLREIRKDPLHISSGTTYEGTTTFFDIDKSMRESAEGKLIDRGSFAPYVDSDSKEKKRKEIKILCMLGKHKWSYCYGSNQAYCERCGKAKLKDKDVRSTMIRG